MSKNSAAARFRPGSATKQTAFGTFGARIVVVISSTLTSSTRCEVLRR